MRNASTATVLAAGLALFSPAVQAAQCAAIPSVQRSADPSSNAAAGGHLARHIQGMASPSAFPQVAGTPMFAGPGAWETAWRALVDHRGMIVCPDDAESGAQYGKTLAVQVDAALCGSADASGRCSLATAFTSATVTYVFEVVTTRGVPGWILTAAYPRP